MTEKIQYIPARLKNAAKGGHVAGAEDIIDDNKGKTLDVINEETDQRLATLEEAVGTGGSVDERINAEKERAEAAEGAINESIGTDDTPNTIKGRIKGLEEAESITYGDENTGVTPSGSDFTNPDSTKRAKVPTVGAILDGLNDGVYDVSKRFPTGGPNSDGKFTLEYILNNADTLIPTSRRHGGMLISFADSSDNKYVQYRLMATSFSVDTSDWALCSEDVLIENPEFIYVKTDEDGRILCAIKTDGSIHWGAGVPQQVIDYVSEKIAELSLEDIVAFLGNLISGDKTLQELLNEKLDAEGLDASALGAIKNIENPEWVDVESDSENKILEGTKRDGTKVISGNTKIGGNATVSGDATILGKIGIQGATYTLIQNNEWIKAIVDSKGKILCGLKKDGVFYANIYGIVNKLEFETSLSELKTLIKSIATIIDNPEYIQVETDSDNKILSGRTPNGNKFENLDFEVRGNLSTGKYLYINGVEIGNIEDIERRIELKIDKENKIISYRSDDGMLHENVGVETQNLVANQLSLGEKAQETVKVLANENFESKGIVTKKYHLPKYGTVNIKSETFYLTADARYSDKNGVYLIQDYQDTDANAKNLVTLSYFYIKSTLTDNGDGTYSKNENSVKLDFYAASKVSFVNDKYYVTSTLEEGQPTAESIEVTQIVDIPPYKAWPVDKKTEHYCIVDFDFGHYYTKNNVAVGVKYQGSSTLANRKRNFRFTFYKNATYAKKDKKKFGEMLRLSGFNLKANFGDNTRIKELLLYAVILNIWNQRPITDRFPWDKEFGYYTGATGFIQGFPVSVSIGDEFYGLDMFGLKKDEKNYMLDGDDDHSGIFVGGSRRDETCWTNATAADWEDEMMDEMSQETADALNVWFDFINERLYKDTSDNVYQDEEITEIEEHFYVTSTLVEGQPGEETIEVDNIPFDTNTIPERLDELGFIDYFICLQTFVAWDSTCRNMILHSRSDKKKMYPFFYDLDLCYRSDAPYKGNKVDADIFDEAFNMVNGEKVYWDMSLWEHIRDMYWDKIVNRWCELRNTILNAETVNKTYHQLTDNIPESAFNNENVRWNANTSKANGDSLVQLINSRLEWLDENYFIV